VSLSKVLACEQCSDLLGSEVCSVAFDLKGAGSDAGLSVVSMCLIGMPVTFVNGDNGPFRY